VTGSIKQRRMRPVRAAMMDEMIRTPYGQMPAYVAAPTAAEALAWRSRDP
jgi:hypothetical protein